jgi:hypothetical protein
MSNDTTAKTRPTHRIYNVTKDAEGKSDWKELGAAWTHRDGQGFNLRFTVNPAAGAEIVLRKVRAKKGGAQ